MLDFTAFYEYFVVVVVLGCLAIGHVIKTASFCKKIPNSDIPVIVAAAGLILNLIVSGLSVESAIYGITMGLASTGMYEGYRNWIEKNKAE